MTVDKLIIIHENFKEQFECGKEGIRTIVVNKDNRLLEITYESDLEWDTLIIPFESVKSFRYKNIKLNNNPFAIAE